MFSEASGRRIWVECGRSKVFMILRVILRSYGREDGSCSHRLCEGFNMMCPPYFDGQVCAGSFVTMVIRSSHLSHANTLLLDLLTLEK